MFQLRAAAVGPAWRVSAQQWQCDNVAPVWRFDGSWERTILVEGSVGPILVIISQVSGENLAKVLPIEHKDVVYTVHFHSHGAVAWLAASFWGYRRHCLRMPANPAILQHGSTE